MQKQRMNILPASRIQSQNSFGHISYVLTEDTKRTSDVCIIVTERETNTFQRRHKLKETA